MKPADDASPIVLLIVLVAGALALAMLTVSRGVAPGDDESANHSQTTAANGAPESRAVSHPKSGRPPRVVIVGAGISGLAAALELGRGGAEVDVLDMASVYGGHAVMSQGSLSIVGSPAQDAAGIGDSPELAWNDFLRFGEDCDREWVRYYVDHSRREIFDFVTDLGVRFEGVVASPGNTVPREHQPAGRGIGLVTPIYRACLEQPTVRFTWNVQAVQLVQEKGRVVGVVGKNVRTGEERRYEADAVVLATGGFQSNLDMVREFWPAEFRFPEKILAGSGRHSVGLGHRLAQAAGGELSKMDHQWNYFTGIPDPRLPGTNRGLSAANMSGIIVNAEGKRFANLHGWAKSVMPPLLREKNATLWFVFDEAIKREFVVSGTDWADFRKVEKEILDNPTLVKKADNWETLAQQAGLPPRALIDTIRRYNELVEKGTDDDFQRFGPQATQWSNENSPKLGKPPFYAMQAWPLTRKSMGGVTIDRACRALDRDRRPIPGLYAVGELSGLAGINGRAALEGTFLGPCIVTGRVAARAILAGNDPASDPPNAPSSSPSEATGASVPATNRCVDCHDLAKEIASPKPGYWHFAAVHRATREKGTDCRHCHAELAPYDAARHTINALSLSASCVQCHVARE